MATFSLEKQKSAVCRSLSDSDTKLLDLPSIMEAYVYFRCTEVAWAWWKSYGMKL